MVAAALCLAPAVALGGCGGGADAPASASPAASAPDREPSAAAAPGGDRGGAAAGAITVSEAWIPDPAGAERFAVYLAAANAAAAEDALVGASSPSAEGFDLVLAEDPGGADMRPVDEIPVPPGGSTELRPDGFHLMAVGAAPIAEGDRVDVDLVFRSGTEMSVTAPVLPASAHPADQAPEDHGGHH
ncbi:hypothetical protein CLV72_105404 [Allonocardiopsis opalescens]|uniref:Copper(I)-binding protein n=1 Tax=Allonocardiopsis opalescens TaxID=1144618 RepID=A0A2T0Q2N4_9ACTN|nr:hypothetical protein CLV72_105404 [Allonocardiopsis opalescens]